MKRNEIYIASFLIATGLSVLGWFVKQGLIESKTADRYVSVKGLAQREVAADRAIWPVSYSIASKELSELQRELDRQKNVLIDFFTDYGFTAEEVTIGVPNIQDMNASYYGGNNYQAFRYIGKGKITIQTQKISAINQVMSDITKLLGKGIVIEQDEYRNQIQYDFSGLNEIKPEMIREATTNAREAAQQFATDANAALGSIRQASQGYFSISDRDINTPYIKVVRVVTSVEYYIN